MIDVKELYLSKEGVESLQKELAELKAERVEITQKIKEAREFGDLSENAEYQEAKTSQSFVEGRIEEIEAMLKHAKIIEDGKSTGFVSVGSTVEVEVSGGKKMTYHITGSSEADPLQAKISNESPLGRALMGHAKGDTVSMSSPDGERKYKIVKIS